MSSSDGSSTLKIKLETYYDNYISNDNPLKDYGNGRFFQYILNTDIGSNEIILDHNELRKYAAMFGTANPRPKIIALATNYFIDMLQHYDIALKITKPQQETGVITITFTKPFTGISVLTGKDFFVKSFGRFEFHNKDALVSLIYHEVFGISDMEKNNYVQDLTPQVDLMAVVEDYLVRLQGADTDSKKYINKFIKVLREFAKYVNTNSIIFTETNKLETVNRFVEYMFPNYGPYQNIDAAVFTEAATNIAKNTQETLEEFAFDYAPGRAQLFAEIEQDPTVATSFMKRVKNVEMDRETKRKKLKGVIADIANLAFLVPEKLSRDYLLTVMADGALHEGNSMLGIKKKLTPEEKDEEERAKKQKIEEQKNQDEIAKLKRTIELKNVKKTAEEAEKSLELTGIRGSNAGGGNMLGYYKTGNEMIMGGGDITMTSLNSVLRNVVGDVYASAIDKRVDERVDQRLSEFKIPQSKKRPLQTLIDRAQQAAAVAAVAAEAAAKAKAAQTTNGAPSQPTPELELPTYDTLTKGGSAEYVEKQVSSDGWCFFYAVNGALGLAYKEDKKYDNSDELQNIEKETRSLINTIIFFQKQADPNNPNPNVYNDLSIDGGVVGHTWATDNECFFTPDAIECPLYIYLKYKLTTTDQVNIPHTYFQTPLVFSGDKVQYTKNPIYLVLDVGEIEKTPADINGFALTGDYVGKHFSFLKKNEDASATKGGMVGGDEDEEEERKRKEKEEEEEERRRKEEEEEEEERKRKEEEEDEDDEKKMDEKEIDEDIKMMNDYKKSAEKLETIKNMVVEAEDVIVRFKPTLDKYTVESPLISLEQVNKDYQAIKLKKAQLTKEIEGLKNTLNTEKKRINEIYERYTKIGDYEVKLTKFKDTSEIKEEELDEIKKYLNTLSEYVKRSNDNASGSTSTGIGGVSHADSIRESIPTKDVIKNLTKETVQTAIKDYLDKISEIKKNYIKIKFEKTPSSYGNFTEDTRDIFISEIETIFSDTYGKTRTSLDDAAFDKLFRATPKYKALLQQENELSYEKDIKKNEAASVEGTLESAIDPVELESQTDLLKEQKEKLHEAIADIKEFIGNIHVDKFKNAWVKDLKELREGSASIENLLQNLIDRTTKAMSVIQTKLKSIHGITTEQPSSSTNAPANAAEPEGRNYGEERRGFFGLGGQPKENVNDPQTAYKMLTEKMGKLKEMIDQLISFAQRNSNSVALMATSGEPSMFVQLYNKYIEDRADPKISKLEASEGLIESVNANQLSPRDILKPTLVDKTVFVALMLIMRLFAMSFTNFLIDKKKLKNIQNALAVYLSIYTAIFLLIVLMVNLDSYRLRIIFNYINVHGGYAAVIGHVLVIWLFATLIFIILGNVRFINHPKNNKIIEARTSEERSKLRKRLSVITMFIFLFATIIVYVS